MEPWMAHSVLDVGKKMPREQITRREMDALREQATYDSDAGIWDFPDACYDYDVKSVVDAIYEELGVLIYEDDFDDFCDYAIDNFNEYDVGEVDFVEEYTKWRAKEKARRGA